MAQVLDRYVVLPSGEARDAIALWIAATHAMEAWEHATRLAITSPAKRCGKTRLLDIIYGLCHRPLKVTSASTAAIFRMIGDDPPTLIIDEADSLFGNRRVAESNEDQRRLINVGFKRNEPVFRCDGPNNTPTEFPTFAMVVLAGIGHCLPDTITDRAVNIHMRRRGPGDLVEKYRERRDGAQLPALREQLAEWVRANMDTLKTSYPDMPVEDREADAWEPLVAIADLAGGDWPSRARRACRVLTKQAAQADAETGNVKLLADIQQILATDKRNFIPSKDLLASLHGIEESPWERLTLHQLAARLKDFGCGPKSDGKVRGYRRTDLSDAIARYVPSEVSEASDSSVDQAIPSDTSDFASVREGSDRTCAEPKCDEHPAKFSNYCSHCALIRGVAQRESMKTVAPIGGARANSTTDELS